MKFLSQNPFSINITSGANTKAIPTKEARRVRQSVPTAPLPPGYMLPRRLQRSHVQSQRLLCNVLWDDAFLAKKKGWSCGAALTMTSPIRTMAHGAHLAGPTWHWDSMLSSPSRLAAATVTSPRKDEKKNLGRKFRKGQSIQDAVTRICRKRLFPFWLLTRTWKIDISKRSSMPESKTPVSTAGNQGA